VVAKRKRLWGYYSPWRCRLRRLNQRLNPLVILSNWEWDIHDPDFSSDGDASWRPTRKAKFATFVMERVRTFGAIIRCLFWPRADDTSCSPLWMHALHRAKAIVCLLFGWRGSYFMDGKFYDTFAITEWNWRQVSYEYDEWEPDSLSVGWGWRNWFVDLDSRGLW
jgi:hypothetical protein